MREFSLSVANASKAHVSLWNSAVAISNTYHTHTYFSRIGVAYAIGNSCL